VRPAKAAFSRFLGADPDRLHACAHSHHPWPDVTFEAQQQAWRDAAALQDDKWTYLYDTVIPEAQGHVARVLGLPDPRTVVFAPNTHELVMRVLSCVPPPIRILTTDAEFHSFSRQAQRLEEAGIAQVATVPLEPFGSFADRFAEAAAAGGHDVVYCSQVFFDSAFSITAELPAIVGAVPDDGTLVVIDGYHGFMALPTDLGPIADQAFYVAGGYKYAMAGEGACFLHCPPGIAPRPVDTGWFAELADRDAVRGGPVAYAADGARFAGGTFDATGVYRLNAVQRLLGEIGWDVAAIHAYVRALQERFLGKASLDPARLIPPPETADRGNFLTFRMPEAGNLYRALHDRNVITDHRADRWRLGFGIYHDEADVDELCARLEDALPAAGISGI
jgi:selenocysteine lyase/cysteine desulfurase